MSAPSDNENPTSDSNTRDPSMALAAAEAAPGEAAQNTPRTASDGDSLSTAKNQAKKREREADDDEDIILSPEKLATMSRSERKRHREKKRRSDVNKGFDDLMNLLLEIDPVVRAEAEDRARRGQWKGSLGAQEENLLSRVELIGRTVEVLRRVHTENEEHKHIIEQLLQQKSAVPKVLNLPPASMSSLAPPANASQQIAALGVIPGIRPDAYFPLPTNLVPTTPMYQPQLGGTTYFQPGDFMGYANPLQNLSQLIGQPAPAMGRAVNQAPANLMDRIAAERDAAAAVARARSKYPGYGTPFHLG